MVPNMNKKTFQAQKTADGKRLFEEPRLAYVKPKLTLHGDLCKVTAGSFGSFDPTQPVSSTNIPPP